MNVSQFKLSNLCGSVYTDGNVVFTPDGNTLLSPVGNRITVFDLINHKSFTFPFENRCNIARLCISPNAHLLISVDQDGHALVINFKRRVLLHQFHFKEHVRDIKFSPDSRYVCVTHAKHAQVWHAPGLKREFTPFVLHREYTGHFDDTTCIDWSPDSRFFITGSKDQTSRVYSLHPIEGFIPRTLAGHREPVVACFFSADSQTVYTISKDAALFAWRRKDERPTAAAKEKKRKRRRKVVVAIVADGEDEEQEAEEKEEEGDDAEGAEEDELVPTFSLEKKHFFNQPDHAKAITAALHAAGDLLVVGFSSGVFGVYRLPEIENVHTLSISHQKITTASINSSGQWLAFGCAALGQVLVWEWQSESYVLKQQGHAHDLNAVSFSPDGQVIASGGDDGKIKVWNHATGFCFATLTWHSGPITGLQFVPNGSALISSSLDGTVRATDLIRYRNFRTMVSPTPVQFTCVAVDSSGEVIAAGALDSFDVYVWSLQNGRLLDVLSAHTAPVSSVAFSPYAGTLASGSWDGSVILWDVYAGRAAPEHLQHSHEVLAVAFRPDGKLLCVSTLDGVLSFWDPVNAIMTGTVEGRRDIAGGRKTTDRMTAKHSAAGKNFNSVCFSADGECVLAGGNSRFVCVYDVGEKLLLRRIQVSKNRSLEGVVDFLNSRNMTDAGALDQIDDPDDSDDDARIRDKNSLPGVSSGDMSSRNVKPAVRTKCVRFSPTGRCWAAASPEGVLVYSVDEQMAFDPTDLDTDLTPESVLVVLNEKLYTKALLMSFRLNEKALIARVLDTIPADQIALVVGAIPPSFVQRVVAFLGTHMESTRLIELHLRWAVELMTRHGRYIRDHTPSFLSALRQLHKTIEFHRSALARICDGNLFTLEYVTTAPLPEPDDAPTAPS